MIRRAFIRRMAGAALASGLLGSELLARMDVGPVHYEVEVIFTGATPPSEDGIRYTKWDRGRFLRVHQTPSGEVRTPVPAREVPGPTTERVVVRVGQYEGMDGLERAYARETADGWIA